MTRVLYKTSSLHNSLNVVYRKWITVNPRRQHITLKHKGVLLFLLYDEIIRIKAEGNYSIIYCTESRTYLVSKTLKTLLQETASDNLIRIHHSHAVNSNFITQISSSGKVLLHDSIEIQISRRRRKEILKKLSMH